MALPPLNVSFSAGAKYFTEGFRDTVTCWVVEGAGVTNVNGTYARSGQTCGGFDVYRKRGTSYALLHCGNEGWSIADVGTADRWSLDTVELYRVPQRPAGVDVPPSGWVPINARAPAPLVRRVTLREQAEHDLAAQRNSHRRPTARIKADPINCVHEERGRMTRVKSEATLPLKRLQRRFIEASMVALGLPDLPAFPPLMPPGVHKTVFMVAIVRIVLWRPNALIEWGFVWDAEAFAKDGSRKLAAVQPGSPLGRWNVWQRLRGRPELCALQGDRLLRVDGAWAFCDVEANPQDANLGQQAVDGSPMVDGASHIDKTCGCVVLDFSRPTRRPPTPQPPLLEVDAKDASLVVQRTADVHAQARCKGWAICLKELQTGVWYSVDGSTEVIAPIASGGELNVFRSERQEAKLWKGLVPDHAYVACVAMLTDLGWSAFSDLSESKVFHITANVKKFWEYAQGRVSPRLVDVEAEAEDGQGSTARPCYCIPTSILPRSSTLVPLTPGPRWLSGQRRCLCIQVQCNGNDTVGLHLSASRDKRAAVVVRVDRGSAAHAWYETQASTHALDLHGHPLVLALRPGDSIVRANGISGAEAVIAEVQRRPEVLALHVERLTGNKQVRSQAPPDRLQISTVLDEMMAKHAEEVQWHALLAKETADLASRMVCSDVDDLEKSYYFAGAAPQEALTELHMEIMSEASKRISSLRRRADVQGSHAVYLLSAMCDVSCGTETLAASLDMYEKEVELNVKESKSGQLLLRRARSLLRLWEWRRAAKKCHTRLLAAVAASMEQEPPANEGLVPVPIHDSPEEHTENNQKDACQYLAAVVAEAKGFTRVLGHDYVEALAASQRHEFKLERRATRRKRAMMKSVVVAETSQTGDESDSDGDGAGAEPLSPEQLKNLKAELEGRFRRMAGTRRFQSLLHAPGI